MPGLVPGIHVFGAIRKNDADGRDKPGHDEWWEGGHDRAASEVVPIAAMTFRSRGMFMPE
jgi:hypothetical protein